MPLSAPNSPLLSQGWLRSLLFFGFFVAAYITAMMGIQKLPGDLLSDYGFPGEFTGILLFFILAIITVTIFCVFVDRRPLVSLGWQWTSHERDAITGLLLGPALLGAGTLILFANNNVNWTDIYFQRRDLLLGLGLMAVVAVGEEMVFRGYILFNLMESFNKWIALTVSAALFALVHVNNPGISVVAIVNVFVAGLFLGINYMYTRNLWFSVFFHFSWNFVQGPVLGYQVSGLNLESLLQMEVKGNPLLTGAEFGFEGSLIQTLLLIMATILFTWYFERENKVAQ
jgi:membrane protease YdiL (CAAX protease family)